jgi:hypothetical protein
MASACAGLAVFISMIWTNAKITTPWVYDSHLAR